MKATAAGALFAFALAGCGGGQIKIEPLPVPAQPIFDQVVVPGQRIGPVALGMQGSDLVRWLGPPVRSHHAFDDGTMNTFANGINAFVKDKDNRVSMISTDAPGYATSGGAGVGSSEIEIRSRMGAPTKTSSEAFRALCYPGMAFTLNQDGRAWSISVSEEYRC